MAENLIIQWLPIIFTIVVSIVTAFWAYARFILDRNLNPCIQPAMECNNLGIHQNKKIVEIILHLKNVGPSVLIVEKIYFDINYITSKDENLSLFGEKKERPVKIPDEGDNSKKGDRRYGRLNFPHSLRGELTDFPAPAELCNNSGIEKEFL